MSQIQPLVQSSARAASVTPPGAGEVSGRVVWTVEKVKALGLTTDVATAASILGFGRTLAFDLLRTNEFPVPVLRVGRKLRVPVPGLLALLGATQPGQSEQSGQQSSQEPVSAAGATETSPGRSRPSALPGAR